SAALGRRTPETREPFPRVAAEQQKRERNSGGEQEVGREQAGVELALAVRDRAPADDPPRRVGGAARPTGAAHLRRESPGRVVERLGAARIGEIAGIRASGMKDALVGPPVAEEENPDLPVAQKLRKRREVVRERLSVGEDDRDAPLRAVVEVAPDHEVLER